MEELIKAANDRLKTSNTRISIQARGGYLSLQGVFPPKPASGKSYPYQQRLTLKIPVSKKGIIAAEKQAILLRYKIDMGEFKWEQPSTAIKTIDELIRDFEADYFSGRQRNPKTLTTWQGEYIKSFNKLKGETLTPESIKEAILSTEPNSRSRKRTAICLRALAKFAGIDVDFIEKLAGTYSVNQVNPRELPTDSLIAEWRDKIPNPASFLPLLQEVIACRLSNQIFN